MINVRYKANVYRTNNSIVKTSLKFVADFIVNESMFSVYMYGDNPYAKIIMILNSFSVYQVKLRPLV